MSKLCGLLLLCCYAQASLASSSLSEELARERGLKISKLDLLGSGKPVPVKAQVKNCSGAVEQAQTADGKVQSEWRLGSVGPAVATNDLLKTKESLMEVSRTAAQLRYQANQEQARKKKSCNIKLFD